MLPGFRQITAHVSDEGIQLLGTIKRDRHDAVVFGDVDLFVHDSFEFRVSSFGWLLSHSVIESLISSMQISHDPEPILNDPMTLMTRSPTPNSRNYLPLKIGLRLLT